MTLKSTIADWDLGGKKTINGIISTFTKVHNGIYYFEVLMPPNTCFPIHWHDCHEKVKVLSGELGDKLQPGVTWKPGHDGDYAYFPPYVQHQPCNDTDDFTTLLVQFYFNGK